MTKALDQARQWGPWSVWKTEVLLGGYLPLFTKAGNRSHHRSFIDGFAGAIRNVERGTGRELTSSPRLALQARPPFTHVLCFETPENADALLETLRSEFPNRAIEVVPGDVNERIAAGLDWWASQGGERSGPVFGQTLVYLDPDSLQLAWETVKTIARFRTDPVKPGGFRRLHLPEMIILFPTGPMRRCLPQPPRKEASSANRKRVDRLFGDSSWHPIYADQRGGAIAGEDSWLHYVEQYRWQLSELGYSHTSAIEVRNTRRVVLYHILFATTNRAGKEIFGAVMNQACKRLPELIEREIRRARDDKSSPRLFEETDDELSLVAAAPDKWARLFTDPPEPYQSGKSLPSERRSTQGDLFSGAP